MRLSLLATLGLLVSAVAPAQTVRTSHRPGIDFSKYHTYKWVSVKGAQHPDAVMDAQIKQSMNSKLARRGLTKAEGTADLAIDYQLAQSHAQVWQTYEDWTATGLMDQRLPQKRQVTVEVGTLVLDMYDTARKELVWSGSANKILDPKSSGPDRERAFDNAAEKLLKTYPPK
jgi:hypothetical protein